MKKAFQPFVLLGFNGTNFVHGKNLFSFRDGHRQMGTSHWDTQYCCFSFGKNAFQSFVLLEFHGMNFICTNNLVSFRETHDKWVVPIGIHDIDALVLRKKHFNPSFY